MHRKNLDWHIEHDDRVAVAYWVEDGWLVAYAFGATTRGVFGSIGFHVAPAPDAKDIVDHVQRLAEQWIGDRPELPLSTRQLRLMTQATEVVQRARDELRVVRRWMAPLPDVERVAKAGRRRDGKTTEQLARVVVRYDELLQDGAPAARNRLADELEVSRSTMHNWITTAVDRGLWITAGRGRAGHPSVLAFTLVRD